MLTRPRGAPNRFFWSLSLWVDGPRGGCESARVSSRSSRAPFGPREGPLTTEWPEGLAFAPGLEAWAVPSRAAVITRSAMREPTPADVHALVDFLAWADAQRFSPDPPVVLHDWRSVHVLGREARAVFRARRRELRTRPLVVVVALDVRPVVRMAIQAATLGAQLVAGTVPVELVDDLGPALRTRAIPAPDVDAQVRLRLAWRAARRS